jgi:hypothetical protein
MQQQLDDNFPSLNIKIIGVNENGQSVANGSITAGRDLPWLQDGDSNNDGRSDVWGSWGVVWPQRPVIIVDAQNNEVTRYSLTDNDLAEEANYLALREMAIDEAVTPQESDWQSPREPLDVNPDGLVVAQDALIIINQLDAYENGRLPDLNGAEPEFYYDPSGDGRVFAQDAIMIINHLRDRSSSGSAAAPLSSGAGATDAPAADATANTTDSAVVVFGNSADSGNAADLLADTDRADSGPIDAVDQQSTSSGVLALAAAIPQEDAELVAVHVADNQVQRAISVDEYFARTSGELGLA